MKKNTRIKEKKPAEYHIKENRSAGYARRRMKHLIDAERIGCSPGTMELMKKDLVHTLQKYLVFEEEQISIRILGEPPVFYIQIPTARSRRNKG